MKSRALPYIIEDGWKMEFRMTRVSYEVTRYLVTDQLRSVWRTYKIRLCYIHHSVAISNPVTNRCRFQPRCAPPCDQKFDMVLRETIPAEWLPCYQQTIVFLRRSPPLFHLGIEKTETARIPTRRGEYSPFGRSQIPLTPQSLYRTYPRRRFGRRFPGNPTRVSTLPVWH